MIVQRLPLILVLLLAACAPVVQPAARLMETGAAPLASPAYTSTVSVDPPTGGTPSPASTQQLSPSATHTPALAASPASRSLEGMDSEVAAISFSTQKPWLASLTSKEQTIWVWDYITGEVVHKIPNVAPRDSDKVLAFQPGSTLLAAGSGKGMITLWDAATGEKVRSF